MVNGELDEIFVNRAKAAAQYGKPVILRILHEPTGQWYPWSFSNQQEADDYINAWKHIVQIYRDNGADNVVFVFSPHNYEPDVIQQTRKYQLIDYVMYHLQEHINLIGVDAYSYPPSGGYINALATGLLDLVSKYQIPIMMGETSSAMSEQDKRIFWDYLARDSKNGMFPFIGIGVFSIAKDENGWKDFHPPADIMRTWERDEFFGPNPFGELKGGKRDKTAGLAAPNLPWQDNSRLIADWIYSGGNQEQFTLLPNGMEEWAWGKVSGGWYGWGAAIDIKDKASLNNGTVSNFELRMPLEILEGEFNLVLEDNQGQPVGKEIRLTRDVLFRYIVDGRLVIPIVQVIQFGTGDKALFNWGNIRQVKIEAISDTGKALFGRAVIGKIVNTDVAEDPDNPDRQAMSEPVELEQNYPNPFDDNGTSISYRLSGDSNNVTVRIFNARGRLVRDIGKVDGGAGRHVIKWDGLNKSGNPVATGTYFIQIDVEGRYRKTIKCVKIRGLSAAPVIGTSATLASQQTLTFGSIDIRPEKAGVLFDAFQAIAIDVDRAIKESKIPALAEQLKMRKWRLKEDMVGIMDSINQEGRVILRAIEDSVGRNCNGDIKRRCFNEFSDKWRKMLIMVSNAGNEKDIAFLRRKAEAFLMQIDAYAQLLEDLRSPNKRRIEVNARQFLEENGQPEYTYKFLVYYMGHARGLFHPVSRISAVRGAL
ncbi:MAG: FlgD immunoglobulin-like domain containing protein [Candidatus Omnitrophota bacterium]